MSAAVKKTAPEQRVSEPAAPRRYKSLFPESVSRKTHGVRRAIRRAKGIQNILGIRKMIHAPTGKRVSFVEAITDFKHRGQFGDLDKMVIEQAVAAGEEGRPENRKTEAVMYRYVDIGALVQCELIYRFSQYMENCTCIYAVAVDETGPANYVAKVGVWATPPMSPAGFEALTTDIKAHFYANFKRNSIKGCSLDFEFSLHQ